MRVETSPATSRVPAAERGPAQRALDRRLDHDAFRFRQPWSSRDQVMVLGPVAALLGGTSLATEVVAQAGDGRDAL